MFKGTLTITRFLQIKCIIFILIITLEGFKEAAEKFATEAGVSPPQDLSLMDERIRIRSAIQDGSIQEAMRMVTTLHPEILDDNSELYFHLQVSSYHFILDKK